jgi:hypothetical protein
MQLILLHLGSILAKGTKTAGVFHAWEEPLQRSTEA